MTTVAQLSERKIRSARLVRDGGSQYYLTEDGTGRRSLRGFGVRIGRRAKTYVLRHEGKPYSLGRFPQLSLREARQLALRLKAQLESGAGASPAGARLALRPHVGSAAGSQLPAAGWWEPAASWQPAGASGFAANGEPLPTVAELKERYFKARVLPKSRPSTLRLYEYYWRVHLLPRFGDLRLDQVTPLLIDDMKLELKETPKAFNGACQQLNAAFRYAVQLEWVARSPAEGWEPYPSPPRRRRITAEEYRRLGKALLEAEQSQRIGPEALAMFWTVLLTGCRPGEVRRARLEWCQLDGPAPVIRWPEGTAKGDRPGRERGRTIWLPEPAAARLRALQRPAGCEFLIPAKDGIRPMRRPTYQWAALLKLAGIENLMLRDARRSYRSEAPSVGVAREHIAGLMGHAPGSRLTDSTYLALHDPEQIAAAGRMGQHIGELLGLEDGA